MIKKNKITNKPFKFAKEEVYSSKGGGNNTIYFDINKDINPGDVITFDYLASENDKINTYTVLDIIHIKHLGEPCFYSLDQIYLVVLNGKQKEYVVMFYISPREFSQEYEYIDSLFAPKTYNLSDFVDLRTFEKRGRFENGCVKLNSEHG